MVLTKEQRWWESLSTIEQNSIKSTLRNFSFDIAFAYDVFGAFIY